MGFFSKLFKGPEIDMEKSNANAKKMRALFNQVVENGDNYRLIFGYTEDVSRFNYGFVHGSKTKIGNLIVGWNEASQTIVVVPTVPDLSGCGDPTYYRRSEILKAYRKGCFFDAWGEHYKNDIWLDCFQECGLDISFYTTRPRTEQEILPWDFIDCGVDRSFLWREWEKASLGEVSPNCRVSCQGCGAARFGSGVCIEPRMQRESLSEQGGQV